MTILRNITAGVRNLWTWFPVIWRDRQFDDGYFYALLHKKLSLMEKHFQSKNCWAWVGMEKDLRKLRVCRILAGRLKDDIYFDMARNAEREAYLQKQDIEYLFNLMTKHIRKWWD